MKVSTFTGAPPARALGALRARLGEPALSLWQREPRLAAFGLLMLVLMLPAFVLLGLDDRVLRGVNVWVKPLKFMASTGLLALTTAWFVGHLPAAVRQGRAVRWIAAVLIATAAFEVGYITLQAALGQASHFNVGDAFHGAMYTLMGLAALMLTATQPALAWLVWKHGDRRIAPAYRRSVILGLVLTFALGASAGVLLGGLQPPTGPGLPVVGWSTTGGDLRVPHFIGIHAEHALPLLGAAVAAWRHGVALVNAAAVAGSLLWAATLVQALMGQPLVGPPLLAG
jgi:hypothetical protein